MVKKGQKYRAVRKVGAIITEGKIYTITSVEFGDYGRFECDDGRRRGYNFIRSDAHILFELVLIKNVLGGKML